MAEYITSPLSVYMCAYDGCQRLYDREQGYYFMRNDQIAEQNRQFCMNCNTVRRLGAHPKHGEKAWLCNCNSRSAEDESFQATL
jgi:hypothetical protein